MEIVGDAVTAAIEWAMSGLTERQRVNAHNIANVATPGFRASRVEFESALERAVRAGHPERATTSVVRTNGAPRSDGNDVVLEQETSSLVRSGLQFDALVGALNHKFGLLRAAIDRR